jgi:hypothetical protein
MTLPGTHVCYTPDLSFPQGPKKSENCSKMESVDQRVQVGDGQLGKDVCSPRTWGSSPTKLYFPRSRGCRVGGPGVERL